VIFTAIPIGVVFGSSFVQYVKWAARGFADPAAYVLFLFGLVILLGRAGEGPRNRFAAAFTSGLLFALALFVRPNIAPGAGILLAGAGLAALWHGQYQRVSGLTIGFLPVLGMALHNWVYGGVLVLFTSTATMAILMPPSVYWAALVELLHLDFAGARLARAVERIGEWLAGPSEAVALVPLHAAAIAVLVRVALWRRADPWLRLVAWATLAQHGVAIFYVAEGRYNYLTWLLTLLMVTAWLHGEGLDLLRRRLPALYDRVAQDRARRALGRRLQRISRLLEAE